METPAALLFNEKQQDFDYNTVIKNKNYRTLFGSPVKIDRIIRDVTGATVLGVSGIMKIKGSTVRGVWDVNGNIMKLRECISIFTPISLFGSIDRLLVGTTESIFQLVNVEEVKE